jgi:hypothetical protein
VRICKAVIKAIIGPIYRPIKNRVLGHLQDSIALLKKDVQTMQANYLQLADEFRMLSLELRAQQARSAELESEGEFEDSFKRAA